MILHVTFILGSPTNDITSNNEIEPEPIYVNISTKKQSNPIKINDLADYIRQNKKNECEGFKKEFGVRCDQLAFISNFVQQ